MAGQLGHHGGGVQFDPQEGGDNTFMLGRGNTQAVLPVEITQPWGEMHERPANPPGGFTSTGALRALPPRPQITSTSMEPYSGLAAAIAKWRMDNTTAQVRELEWQRGVGGDKTKITQFQEIAGALQEFKMYLFVKPGSAFCMVVHSPMKFMAISKAT